MSPCVGVVFVGMKWLQGYHPAFHLNETRNEKNLPQQDCTFLHEPLFAIAIATSVRESVSQSIRGQRLQTYQALSNGGVLNGPILEPEIVVSRAAYMDLPVAVADKNLPYEYEVDTLCTHCTSYVSTS